MFEVEIDGIKYTLAEIAAALLYAAHAERQKSRYTRQIMAIANFLASIAEEEEPA